MNEIIKKRMIKDYQRICYEMYINYWGMIATNRSDYRTKYFMLRHESNGYEEAMVDSGFFDEIEAIDYDIVCRRPALEEVKKSCTEKEIQKIADFIEWGRYTDSCDLLDPDLKPRAALGCKYYEWYD